MWDSCAIRGERRAASRVAESPTRRARSESWRWEHGQARPHTLPPAPDRRKASEQDFGGEVQVGQELLARSKGKKATGKKMSTAAPKIWKKSEVKALLGGLRSGRQKSTRRMKLTATARSFPLSFYGAKFDANLSQMGREASRAVRTLCRESSNT